ncbi:DsbA family protein [Actinopolymorpha pittospori]|uniref:DsbA family dithiol-disulfide isomerase n=1 Tax=Actinopolymorpha pittospori TaxID=648752 RepID=A0A927MXL8_9ACTN|nr:putative DsbA family dithiol-disulfide isomerase [Actinopolymorpha pittospori]
MRVEIWADLVCPWCYLGKRRFEKALAGFEHAADVEVVHRSFQLDPTAPPTAEHQVEQLAAKYGMSIEEMRAQQVRLEGLATEEGLEYHLKGSLSGNTADAHRLLHLGKERGLQDAVVERFYRAQFTEHRSLFDHDSLVDLAAEAGLDPDEARRTLEQGTYADDVVADAREAQELGANGVPFFVVADRYGVSGAQPVELFSEALTRAWDETHAPDPA